MLNTTKHADIEDIGYELELINGLLDLTDEFVAELPREEDEECRWKLELFCQRQNLLRSLLDAIQDKTLQSIYAINQIINDNAKTSIHKTECEIA